MAERRYPVSEVSGGGQEEIPSVRGQRRRREELPRPRSGMVVRGGGREEIPHTPKPEARGGGRED